MRRMAAGSGGFSLVEIMVVVVIMGLLAGVVAVNVRQRMVDAQINRAKADISTISTALDLFYLDNSAYPSSDQGLQALVKPPTTDQAAPNFRKGGYLKKLPKDPWGQEYIYRVPGQHGDYDILSGGPDKNEGGDDDITSWDENG